MPWWKQSVCRVSGFGDRDRADEKLYQECLRFSCGKESDVLQSDQPNTETSILTSWQRTENTSDSTVSRKRKILVVVGGVLVVVCVTSSSL
jgi:hypothetical protein